MVMVFNTTFNNISGKSRRSVLFYIFTPINHCICGLSTGADPGFQVRGAHLKKLRQVEGGAKIFGVFRVKNHDFTAKNHIFLV
jgi:hypothetical protein